MEILYMLIPLAVLVMAIALVGLVWAIRSGQFEDLEGPAHRILMDDDDPRIPGPDRGADLDTDKGSEQGEPRARS
ncbi:MAG: cbb3-type cytochrome oxidase assembly protein CcoS [Pseudomonadota bacterium]|nr:MAG: cbb3-type cytochrome oxidase assembly protein CcoS [Pseudomonadota bacterium]